MTRPIRLLLVAIAVAACAAIGGWLFGVDREPSPTEAGHGSGLATDPPPVAPPAPPSLVGTPGVRTVAAAARAAESGGAPKAMALHGTVRDTEGKPIPHATVYVIDKSRAPEDRDPRARTETGEDGRWALSAAVGGRWIAAIDNGHLPAHIDGDSIRNSALDIDFVMKHGLTVTVMVRDAEGMPVPDVRVSVAALGTSATRSFPAPDESPAWIDAMGLTGVSGEAAMAVGTTGPISIVVPDPAYYVEPEHPGLDASPGRIEITVRPSCTLRGTVVEAETGDPIEYEYSLSLKRVDNEQQEYGAHFSMGGDGFTATGGIRPGDYRLTITSQGRRDWVSGILTAKKPGDEMTVKAEMVRLDTIGGLLLRLVRPPGASADTSDTPSRPTVLLRLGGDTNAMWSRTSREPRGKPKTSEVLIPDLKPGSYEVLVWYGDPPWTGWVRQVVVRGGATAEESVPVTRGTMIEPEEPITEANRPKGARISATGAGHLPVVAYRTGYSLNWTEQDGWPWQAQSLGPYPFDVVTASLVMPDGSKRELTARAR